MCVAYFQAASSSNDSVLHDFIERIYDCKWNWSDDSLSAARDCQTLRRSELSEKLQVAPEVNYCG